MADPDCPLCGFRPIERRLLGEMFQLMLDLRSCPEDMGDDVQRLADHLSNDPDPGTDPYDGSA